MTEQFVHNASTYSNIIDNAVAFTGQDHDFFIRAKADLLAEMLQAEGLAGRARLLDVGCGVGLFEKFLAPHVGLIEGVDVSVPSLEQARRANPGVRYTQYDGERLPFESASFDLGFAVCVLHHVPPPKWLTFMAEMRRVVMPDRLVVVMEHNPNNPLTRRLVDRCPLDSDAVLLSAARSRELFIDAGLINVRSRFFLFTPFANPIARWVERGLGWLPFGAQYLTVGRVKK